MHIRREVYSFFFVLVAIAGLSGCSDSFLQEQPEIKYDFGTIYVPYKNEVQTLNLELPIAQQASYQVRQYPKWMNFPEMNGTFSNGLTMLPFSIISGELPNFGSNSGDLIIDIEGVGLAQIRVTVKDEDPGLSLIYIDPPALDFGTELSDLSFSIRNASEIGFAWNVTDCPDWIRLDHLMGGIAAGEQRNLYAGCIRENLDPGVYNGQITIEIMGEYGLNITRNVAVSATVVEMQNPSNVTAIEGRVMDAVYCKQTDRLFIATQQPNKLLIYGKGETASEIALNRSPRCLSLSENGTELFVGHSGLITRINTETLKITRSYELDFSVFSLVSGEDGWLYLSPDADYVNEQLISLNLSSGQLLRKRLDNG